MVIRRAGPLLVSALLAGCGGAGGTVHQGVIEQDEEVLSFLVPGRIEAVAVAEGQRIAAGAEIAHLEGSDLRLAVAETEAELALAEAELARITAPARDEEVARALAALAATRSAAHAAGIEVVRQRELLEKDAGASQRTRELAEDRAAQARAEVDTADAQLDQLLNGATSEELGVARAQVEHARATRARARERLDQAVLHGPPGPRLVRHVHLRPGTTAEPGIAVVTVADDARPYIDAFVPQQGLAALAVGGAATVRADGAGAVEGRIGWIGERLEFTPRYLFGEQDRPNLVMRVRVRLAGTLPAGIPATVDFHTADAR